MMPIINEWKRRQFALGEEEKIYEEILEKMKVEQPNLHLTVDIIQGWYKEHNRPKSSKAFILGFCLAYKAFANQAEVNELEEAHG